MRYAGDRPYAYPEAAARKLLEIANATEAIQDGRIHIEKLNGPFCSRMAAAQRMNTWPALNWRSPAVGCGGTSPGPM
jgi:hypothetical protein